MSHELVSGAAATRHCTFRSCLPRLSRLREDGDVSATDQDPGRPLQPHREPDEFDALLREAGWVRTLARRLARDQAAADDVAQGTLALALERRPGTRGSMRPWLARVVVRLTRRQRRGDARRQFREGRAAVVQSATSPGSDELLVRLEEQQRLA